MAPLLNTLISRIVFGETKKKKGDLPRPSSIAFSEGDFPGSYHQHSHSAVNSPDRGSSPQHLHSTSGPFQTTPPPPASLHSALNGNGQQLPSGTTAEDMLDDPAQQLSVTAGADVRDSEQIRAAVQSETKPDSRGHHVESQAQRLSHESSTSNSEQGIDSRAGPHHLDSSQGNRADSGVSEVRNGNDAATSGSHNGGGLGAEGSDPEVLQDDGVLSEQGVVEAETIVSSRDDLASLVQGTNELIGQLVSRNL